MTVNDVIVCDQSLRKKILRKFNSPERKVQVYKIVLISRKFGIISKGNFANLKNAQYFGISVKRVYQIKTHWGGVQFLRCCLY